ncbi:Putative lipoprotein transmembrane [Burkholderia diffusa]|uniref:hypothetical protein n=1 Tax=Burkholderia diffusa TaxID=488732 RepID=UPI001CB05631|nr:hypothetical protein [Burkholderia diffusa]CAG9241120.1 Putative lipoprotein transmembrane [Burkholderia diffusa]
MQGKRVWLASLMSTAMLLSACGGGDSAGTVNSGGSTSNNTTAGTPVTTTPVAPPPVTTTSPPAAQVACRATGSVTYSGSASQVATNNGQLAVVLVPNLPIAYSKNRNMTAPNAPASSQVQQASGAFTTLASSAAATDCLGLDHGAVTEIQSVGSDVAIGRWNQAMDTDGNTYTAQQGIHYAVGTPLSLTATSGTLACTQLIADTVTSDGGPTGTLGTTTATLDLATRTLNNLSLSINLANTPYTLTNTTAPLNSVSSGGSVSVQSVVVGHDATQPLVAVGYSATLPNTQGIGGVVVLSCR